MPSATTTSLPGVTVATTSARRASSRLEATRAPISAAVTCGREASARASVSAASTAAAPVRSAVTAAASRSALGIPFDASESTTIPVTVGSP
jgi:hypothetical protein